MSISLSNLVDNVSGVYDKECKKCIEKKLGWITNLLGLKMVDWIISVKNVKNHTQKEQMDQLKLFQLYINFVKVISISFFFAIKKRYLSSWIYG